MAREDIAELRAEVNKLSGRIALRRRGAVALESDVTELLKLLGPFEVLGGEGEVARRARAVVALPEGPTNRLLLELLAHLGQALDEMASPRAGSR